MESKLRMPTCRHATNVQLTRMEAMCIGDKGCMCYMCICECYKKLDYILRGDAGKEARSE